MVLQAGSLLGSITNKKEELIIDVECQAKLGSPAILVKLKSFRIQELNHPIFAKYIGNYYKKDFVMT